MSQEMKTQGTELWVLDDTPAAPAPLKIGNITNIGELGSTTDDIEVTNLDDVAKQYIQGLPDNGEISLELNLNKGDAGHKFLWKLAKAGGDTRKKFIILGSDGVGPPTIGGTDITAPAGRFFMKFNAGVKSFKTAAIAVNTVLKATASLRVSGEVKSTLDEA